MIFNLFKRKKKQQPKDVFNERCDYIDYGYASLEDDVLTKKELKAFKDEDYRFKKIRDICNQISDANLKTNESIEKYKIICDRIADLSIILNSDDEKINRLQNLAYKISELIEDRVKYEKSKDTLAIDTAHYLILEKNENSMINEIRKLEEYEKEYLAIRSDLHKLEGERGNLNYERNKLNTNRNILKYYVRLLIGISIVLFTVFGFVAYKGDGDVITPVLITVSVIAFNAMYVVSALRKNEHKMEANRIKENKLIGLFNKTKLKYYNSVRLVEYVHNKFEVNNCKELKNYWDRYLKEKDRKFKYGRKSEMIEIQKKSFLKELEEINLQNVSVWKDKFEIFKSGYILKEYEQKLLAKKNDVRQDIEYNKHLVTAGMKNINTIINTSPQYRDEIISILRECNVEL